MSSAIEYTMADEALCDAVAEGNLRGIKQCIAEGANVNEVCDESLEPPLIAALTHPDLAFESIRDIVSALIAAGANPNIRSAENGWTPLFTAAHRGKQNKSEALALMRILCLGHDGQPATARRGMKTRAQAKIIRADVNLTSTIKQARESGTEATPLYLAIQTDNEPAVKLLLLQCGADVNTGIVTPTRHLTPLSFAVERSQQGIVEIILADEGGALYFKHVLISSDRRRAL